METSKQQGSKKQKLVTAGAITLLADPLLSAIHTPTGIAAAIAFAAGVAVFVYFDEAKGVFRFLPNTPPEVKKQINGNPSLLYRLFHGKSVREERRQTEIVDADEEVDTEPLTSQAGLIQEQKEEGIFPHYPANETLHLGKAIDRMALAVLSKAYIQSLQSGKRVTVTVPGQRFDPHFNGLFGKGIIAAANQGFGKSILNGVIIEQAGACGVPVVVLDHKGEYDTVAELPFVNGLLVGAEGGDFELTADNAFELVELVMRHRYQAIINLASYGSGWIDRARIVAAVGRALMDYAEQQRRAGEQVLPCLVLVDEAQLYFPQQVNLLPPEAQENRAVLSELSNAYFALVSNGRSNGYTMCFATQSLTYIAKWAIKSCQIRVLGRHSEKNDLDMCEQIINASVAGRKEIESFAPGVFVVFGFTPQPMVVQFDRKQSRDLSETPGIERLRAPRPELKTHETTLPQPTMGRNEMLDLILAAMQSGASSDEVNRLMAQLPAVPEQVAQYPSGVIPMRRPVATDSATNLLPETEMQMAVSQTQHHRPSSALPPDLQDALQMYEPGMSYRDLGKRLNIGKDAAGNRINELKRRKLI